MSAELQPVTKRRNPITGAWNGVSQAVYLGRRLIGKWFSVRWKLTLLYGLMCAFTLGLVGVVLWIVLARQTQDAIDRDLRSASTLITGASRIPAKGLYRTIPASKVPQSCQRVKDMALRSYCAKVQTALDNFATKIFSSSHGPGQFEQVHVLGPHDKAYLHPKFLQRPPDIILFGVILLQVLNTKKSLYTTLNIQGRQTRVFFTPLTLPAPLAAKKDLAVLEVFQVETTFLEILDVARLILLIVLPLGVLVALLAGWFIARIALRPIDRISRRVHAIGVSQDLSQRLLFRGPEDEVSRLAFTFDGMMGRLEALFNAQKRFVADASHELRTPLTAIRGNADLLRIAPADEREDIVGSIRRESERMSRLVNDLLLLAESDLDQQSLHLQAVDLNDLLEDVYRSAILLAGSRLEVAMDMPDQVTVQADPDRLKQLLLNLADNAVKFTPLGGTVTLALHAQADGACIRISDTGVGISLEEQQAIFRRFYRVEESRSTRGTGLGLAISASIVEAHQGRITVESTPGEGSAFSVWLPCAP